MKTSILSILFTCFFLTSMISQNNLNEYKYVIVSKKFDFLKEADKYQLNSLLKFLFNKNGFIALMEGEKYPEDLMKNRCLALEADALKEPGMFKTKLSIELTDCNDILVYTSLKGESKEKEFKTAYTAALRQAFKSFELMHYVYIPKEHTAIASNLVNKTVSAEIVKLRQELQILKNEKDGGMPPEELTTAVAKTNTKAYNVKEEKIEKTLVGNLIEVTSNVLYAQEVEGGFQLVDSAPKVIYKIFKTQLSGVFLVENQSAIIYKEGDNWILENPDNKQKLTIKF